MKHILKGKTPQSLTDYKRTPNATYEGFGAKDVVRQALIHEQKGLCAYCNGRISNDWDGELKKYKTGIEHHKSQDEFPHLQLDYANMLGVCTGIATDNESRRNQHCDKSKANQLLTIDPLSINCENEVFYTLDGRIHGRNEVIQRELDTILNLNQSIILKNRKTIVDIVIKRMGRFYPKKDNRTWSKTDILKEINYWQTEDEQGHLKPYLQIALAYLQNKLNRLA
jgi:uncharacterized protein (TIGR02646 family)